MIVLLVCLILSSGYASVKTIIENYPFSPARKYPPASPRGEKPQTDQVLVIGYAIQDGRAYILVREEGKVRKLSMGDEFMGGKILGVRRGFLMVRDYEGVKKLKISWERIRETQNPAESTNRGVQRPPRQLMELLQEGK